MKTEMEKAMKVPKAVNIPKDDRQAFRLLVGKATFTEEVHSYSLTTAPRSETRIKSSIEELPHKSV